LQTIFDQVFSSLRKNCLSTSEVQTLYYATNYCSVRMV